MKRLQPCTWVKLYLFYTGYTCQFSGSIFIAEGSSHVFRGEKIMDYEMFVHVYVCECVRSPVRVVTCMSRFGGLYVCVFVWLIG